MMRHRYLPATPKPQADRAAGWGRASRALRRDPSMVHLGHTYWARVTPVESAEDSVRPPGHRLDLPPAQKAALLQPLLGPDVAVSGLSAAQLWGIPVVNGMGWVNKVLGEPIPVQRPPGAAQIDLPHLSFRARRKHQGHRDWILRKGMDLPLDSGLWGCQVTGALETLLSIQPWVPGWRAVVAADHILATGLDYGEPTWPIRPEDLLPMLDQLPPYTRGAPALRNALERCAPNVWSPMETLTRLILVREGLPPATPNFRVRLSDGGTVFLDLAWPHAKVAVEYNGAVHYRDRQTYGDEMHRLARLKRDGWEVFVVVLEDLADHARRTTLIRSLKHTLAARGERL